MPLNKEIKSNNNTNHYHGLYSFGHVILVPKINTNKKVIQNKRFSTFFSLLLAQSAASVEYTDFFSAEGVRPPYTHIECPRYDTTQSDGEAQVMLEL